MEFLGIIRLMFCLFFVLFSINPVLSCFFLDSSACGCQTVTFQKQKGKGAYCHQVTNYQDIFLHTKKPSLDIISIDLTNNGIEELTRSFFRSLPALKNTLKLLLGENQLGHIAPGAFADFQNLKFLNLSSNSLGRINKEMFTGLPSLQRLILNYNMFPIITGDAFTNLHLLKRLDIASDYLVCNCLMDSFVAWYRSNVTNKIKLTGKCHLPLNQDGNRTALRKLRNNLSCDVINDLPYFQIQPSQRQVVFEDDQVILNCEGTDLVESKVKWTLYDQEFDSSTEVFQNTTLHPNRTVISSSIQLKAAARLSGLWKCTIKSNVSRKSDQVDIIVIENNATYCNRVNVTNDYGFFQWVEAISGAVLTQNCTHQENTDRSLPHLATRSCLSNGVWSEGDYSRCQYVDNLARIIANDLRQNISANNAITNCADMTKTISNIPIKEPIGLKMIAALMDECHQFFVNSNFIPIGDALTKLASHSLTASSNATMASQLSAESCDKIRNIVQRFTVEMLQNVSSFVKTSANLAITAYQKRPSMKVLLCNVSHSSRDLLLHCDTNKPTTYRSNTPIYSLISSEQAEASQPAIIVPTVFNLKNHQVHQIYVKIYRTGSLFQSSEAHSITLGEYSAWKAKSSKNVDPEKEQSEIDDYNNDNRDNTKDYDQLDNEKLSDEYLPEKHVIISNVYSVTTDVNEKFNLTKPIVMLFQTKEIVYWPPRDKQHYVAMWNGEKWLQSNGFCRFNRSSKQQRMENITIVECSALGTFAIIKNINKKSDVGEAASPVQLLHPTVFVGSGLLTVALIMIIFTYITFANLVISRDARHMVINTCFHILLGVIAFAIGVWRVDEKVFCYSAGISLHYASLSVLLWILLSARNISKEMLLSQQPPTLEPKPQRPMLRFYLLGSGIPIIICGITAAAKIENYNGDEKKYCWLSWETSLYAFYAPAALMTIGCILVLLRILATLNCAPTSELNTQHKHLYGNDADIDEGTPLRYRDSTYNGNTLNDPCLLGPLPKEIDNEHNFRTRLRGVSLLLFFFVATWVFAALSVAAPQLQPDTYGNAMDERFDYQIYKDFTEKSTHAVDLSIVFSCLFAAFSSAMGVFVSLQHLLTRRDVVANWKSFCQRKRQRTISNDNDCRSNDIDVITNFKSSNKSKRDNAASVTEGNTLETVLHTTGGDVTSSNLSHEAQMKTSNHFNENYFIVNSMCSGDDVSSYKEPSRSDNRHKGKTRSTNASTTTGCNRLYSTGHQHSNKIDSYGNCHHRHSDHQFYRHHYTIDGSKPIKITNLQQHRHDSSMTEHSFDETQMKMHTIPVVMQTAQPKIDNSALFHKYQKIRKNLEAKRNRQRKLTVLREYAQDPLTSNDEKDGSREKDRNETTPLVVDQYGKDDAYNDNLAINEYKKADMNEKFNNGIDLEQNYRPLLISSPSRKKEESKPPRLSRNPNLASNYKRRSSQQNNKAQSSRMGSNRRRSSGSRRKPGQLRSHDPNRDKNPAAVTAVNCTTVLKDAEMDMSLHGISSNNTPAQTSHKSHSYLTASDVLSSSFHVPSRKASRCELDGSKLAQRNSTTSKAPDANDDDVFSNERAETTL
ncbi:unnamed protein product [Clavelina lepadiformis]|uniref:Adhesion G protein-coupled receptor A3 n=1 Tax=Clavelina lepadiformis TaxID=159417 RepID=A0ABP0GBS9_CLALP